MATYALKPGLAVSFNNSPTTATRASGGASGSTSVIISAANSNIVYDQTITGTGFAANTKVTSVSGTTINFSPAATSQISGTLTFSTTWYPLTDHNRREIDITPTLIEKESRMANGTLRKFIVAKKDIISASWDFLPSKPVSTGSASNDASFPIADSNSSFVVNAASWMQSFYNANVGIPIYLRVVSSVHTDPSTGTPPLNSTYLSASTGQKIYQVFMTGFSRSIRKRNPVTDFVDVTLEFTEV